MGEKSIIILNEQVLTVFLPEAPPTVSAAHVQMSHLALVNL